MWCLCAVGNVCGRSFSTQIFHSCTAHRNFYYMFVILIKIENNIRAKVKQSGINLLPEMSSLIYLNAFFCISFYYNNNYLQLHHLYSCIVVWILKGGRQRRILSIQCICHLLGIQFYLLLSQRAIKSISLYSHFRRFTH